MKITLRGRQLYLYKRVPKRYEAVEPRQFVWISLHTDSQFLAAIKATTAWGQMLEGYPSAEWGRWVLQSITQSAMTARA